MKLIKKTSPPNSLTEYRKQKSISYEDIDRDVKDNIYASLKSEQKGICAYCQQLLKSEFKIEHHCERSICTDKTLDYTNMFAVCHGNSGSNKDLLHCDSKKATYSRENGLPMKINPLNNAHMQTIQYTSTGLIKSTNTEFNSEINNILNLNVDYLKRLRKKKWTTITKVSMFKNKVGLDTKKLIRLLEKELSADAYVQSFPGLSEFYLNRYKRK